MGQAGLARVGISVTTLDAIWPAGWSRAARPPRIGCARSRRLAKAGVPVRIMASPIVPGLTDHELEAILKAARDAGAVAASTIPCACRARSRSCGRIGWPSITPTGRAG
jgi:DNA repair photolyase